MPQEDMHFLSETIFIYKNMELEKADSYCKPNKSTFPFWVMNKPRWLRVSQKRMNKFPINILEQILVRFISRNSTL